MNTEALWCFTTILLSVNAVFTEGNVFQQDGPSQSLLERVKSLELTVKEQSSKIRLLESRTQDSLFERTRDRDKRSRGLSPVFSAYLSDELFHIGLDQVIAFDKVLLNQGGFYNTTSGVFTVPASGVYLLYYSIANSRMREVLVKLVVDGKGLNEAVVDPVHQYQEMMGSNLAIVHLIRGQRVWVSNFDHVDNNIRSFNGYRFATFSGVLLYQD